MAEQLLCEEQNAQKYADWITNRAGLAVWYSADLSNLGLSWTTPVKTQDGEEYQKPTWQASSKPSKIITDPAEVTVVRFVEKKRIRISTRMGSQGFKIKLTDASSQRLRKACAQIKDSHYYFDYDTHQAVIIAPERLKTLKEWMAETSGEMYDASADAVTK